MPPSGTKSNSLLQQLLSCTTANLQSWTPSSACLDQKVTCNYGEDGYHTAKHTYVAELYISACVVSVPKQQAQTSRHCAEDKEGDVLTSASIVSKHPQDGAGPWVGAYIAACSMLRYLHTSSYAVWNSVITVSPVFYKVSNNDWPCSKLCWCKSLQWLHSLPLWELAVSMQEKQAVPLRVLPPKVHLFGPSWLRTDDLQIPVRR